MSEGATAVDCTHCGFRDSGRFCSGCGAPLPKVCPCGRVLPEDAGYCPGCGSRVASEPATGAAQSSSTNIVAKYSDVKIDQPAAAPGGGSTYFDIVAPKSSFSIGFGRQESEGETLVRRREAAEKLLRDGAFRLAYEAAEETLTKAPGYLAVRFILVQAAHRLGRREEVVSNCAALLGSADLSEDQRGPLRDLLFANADVESVWTMFGERPSVPFAGDLLDWVGTATEMAVEQRLMLIRRIWQAASQSPAEDGWNEILALAIDTARELGKEMIEAPLADRIAVFRFLSHELIPSFAEGWRDLGALLYEDGEFVEARDSFQRAVAIDPGEARSWYWLGISRWDLGEIESAGSAFEKACALEPETAHYQLAAGTALRDLGRREDALAHLHAACELEPDNAESLAALGILERDLGRNWTGYDEDEWI